MSLRPMQGESNDECHRYLQLPHRREQEQCQAGFILDSRQCIVNSTLFSMLYRAPNYVGLPHWLAALCRLAPSCCMLCCALVNLCKETNMWHCTKKPNAAFANIRVLKVRVFSCCVCCPNRNTLDISYSNALPLQLNAPSAHWEH